MESPAWSWGHGRGKRTALRLDGPEAARRKGLPELVSFRI